jgi:hypothetical protein
LVQKFRTVGGVNFLIRLGAKTRMSKLIRAGKKSCVANLSKYRVLLAGIPSPLLALVLNVIFILRLLALSLNPAKQLAISPAGF